MWIPLPFPLLVFAAVESPYAESPVTFASVAPADSATPIVTSSDRPFVAADAGYISAPARAL